MKCGKSDAGKASKSICREDYYNNEAAISRLWQQNCLIATSINPVPIFPVVIPDPRTSEGSACEKWARLFSVMTTDEKAKNFNETNHNGGEDGIRTHETLTGLLP